MLRPEKDFSGSPRNDTLNFSVISNEVRDLDQTALDDRAGLVLDSTRELDSLTPHARPRRRMTPAHSLGRREHMADNELSLVATGDVFVSGFITHTGGRVQDNRRENPDAVFDLVVPFLRGKDIVFCNLEGPFCKPGKTLQYKRSSWYSDPKNVSALKYAGFNIVSLANNQTMGYSAEGLMETIETLKRAGIAYVGAGENLEEARKPVFLSQKNITVGF